MVWAIIAMFIATSMGWLLFIMFAINWAQNQELKKRRQNEKEGPNEQT